MSKQTQTEVKNGNTVQVHYVGTFDDGTEFDNSHLRGEALTFTVGQGEMIPGFDSALVGMKKGETKKVKINSDDAYGEPNEELVQEVPNEAFPSDFEFKVDAMVHGKDPAGRPFMAKVQSINDSSVTLDFNHPMSGKNLNFEIELIEVE